jgi:predicted RNA binding protein YcfA (HicA-like mRNA interferase family)
VVSTPKLIQKLTSQTIKRPELNTLLSKLGLELFRGKGSHRVWGHRNYPDLHIVIATHGKDVPKYQLKQIENSLKKRGII